jgi:uncharacterized protein
MTTIREFVDSSVQPGVRGFLHTPQRPNGQGLVLTHGAGGNAQAPLLRALAEVFTHAGFTVLRCDLPFRQTRSFGPPGPADGACDRAGLKSAITTIRQLIDTSLVPEFGRSGDLPGETHHGTVFLGGHSYGGRQASMLCAEEPDLAAGLLLLSYPLHPPRRPEQQRTQHLPDLRTPTLFVHGTRDPFGSIEELERAIKMIPARTRLLTVEGAGHDLGFKGKTKKEELPKRIRSKFAEFVGDLFTDSADTP